MISPPPPRDRECSGSTSCRTWSAGVNSSEKKHSAVSKSYVRSSLRMVHEANRATVFLAATLGEHPHPAFWRTTKITKSPQIPVFWNCGMLFALFFWGGLDKVRVFLLWNILEKPTCGKKSKIFWIWKSKECWKTTMSVDGKWGLHLAAQRVTGL